MDFKECRGLEYCVQSPVDWNYANRVLCTGLNNNWMEQRYTLCYLKQFYPEQKGEPQHSAPPLVAAAVAAVGAAAAVAAVGEAV